MSVLATKLMYAQELQNLAIQAKLVKENNNLWNGVDDVSIAPPPATQSAQDLFYNQSTMESDMGSIDTSRQAGETIAQYLTRMDIAQNGVQTVSDQKALVNQRVLTELKNKINMLTKNAVVTEMIINSNDFTDGEKIDINSNWASFAMTVATSPPITVTYFNYQVDQFFYGKNKRPLPVLGAPPVIPPVVVPVFHVVPPVGPPPPPPPAPATPVTPAYPATPVPPRPPPPPARVILNPTTPRPTGRPPTFVPTSGFSPATPIAPIAPLGPLTVPIASSPIKPVAVGTYVIQDQRNFEMSLQNAPEEFVLVLDDHAKHHIMFIHNTELVEMYEGEIYEFVWAKVKPIFKSVCKTKTEFRTIVENRLKSAPDMKSRHLTTI